VKRLRSTDYTASMEKYKVSVSIRRRRKLALQLEVLCENFFLNK
jgi:hypothetical protein